MGHKIMSIRHLSMSDRSRIEVYLELCWSISRIAKEIKFSKQAISREVTCMTYIYKNTLYR